MAKLMTERLNFEGPFKRCPVIPVNRVGISMGHHAPTGQAFGPFLIIPMLLVVFNVVPTTHETFFDVGRQGCCRGGLLPSQRRCSRRANTHRGRCTAADPLQRVKQAKPYCSQRVVGISVHRQVGSLQPNVGSQGTRGSQRSGCRSDSSPCLPALPPAVHSITVKLISTCLQHLTGLLANSPSRHPEAGGAAPPRPRLPCKNRHPTGLAPAHCPGGVIPHPSYIKRRCARPDVAKHLPGAVAASIMGATGRETPVRSPLRSSPGASRATPARTPLRSSPGVTRPQTPPKTEAQMPMPSEDKDENGTNMDGQDK